MVGASEGRSLEQTPTWAVATVCFMLVVISIVIELIIHKIGQWFKKKQKRALYESLEKIKGELMLVGFISLLLAVGTTPITKICISESAASTWHPCNKQVNETLTEEEIESRRRLLAWSRRILVGSNGGNKCAEKGKVSFMSSDGVHQLHIFIFVLAVSHVLYCILTMALGRLKMRSWKQWEMETKTAEYQFSHDPERIRFTRDTSFGRRHMNFWSESRVLLWIAHLAPHNHLGFDFQKYINRSLEEDFKVVLSISPPIWLFAVVFLLLNTHGLYSYLWLPFIPLIVVLLVGTKLQMIITQMGLNIKERGKVVKGVPVVEPGDHLFWFNRPRLLLYLLNFVLFQNAFQLAFFSWSAYQFELKSCFHEHMEDIVIRITTGVLIQILCSYVTLPLYALVTQMGSTMKPTIFNDRVATALRKWHHTARKHIKENKKWDQAVITPTSSRPETPSNDRNLSPIYLLHHHYWSNLDSLQTTPTPTSRPNENWDVDSSPSSTYPMSGDTTSHHEIELSYMDDCMDQYHEDALCSNTDIENQHEVTTI